MPTYTLEIGGKTYDIESEKPLSDADLAKHAKTLGAPAPTQAAQPSEIPMGRRVMEFVRPTVEALGAAGGGVLGTALGPAGTVGGAGLGYGIAKGGLDVLEQALGYQRAPASVGQALRRGAEDVLAGAAMEAGGRGVVAPLVGKTAEYVNKLRNLKLDTYLTALEGKGDDILNALRGPRSAVPGAAPGAGEVAAPAGSVRFSTLQAKSQQVPGLASEYAGQAAQTTEAQIQQQARASAKFDRAASKVQAKIDSALTPLRPEDTGAALTAAAEAERQSMKKGVIEPAYQKAFAAAGDAKVDMTNVIAQAEDILGRKLSSFDPSTAPETVRKLLSLQPKAPPPATLGAGAVSSKIKVAAPAAEPAEVTLQQLDDIRKAINVDIAAGKVSSDPGAAMRLRSLGQIHNAIDDAVAQSTTLPAEAKALYKNALDTYRTQYVPRFKTGVNEQLFRSTGLNEPKIKPEDVVTKYFQPKGVSEANNFLTLFPGNPKAQNVLRAGIEDLYTREVKEFTPEAHAAFLRKYADPIRVLDDAGMNVLQRIDVVGKNAARLQKINELAAAANVKLPPPLPPGASADAVQNRISELTKGLGPRELEHVNAVRQDLLRRGEYERLVKAGAESGVDIKSIGTKTGKELGLPLPSFLSVPLTVFNATFKRLALRLDDKLAMEIAREMTNPALAAKSVEQAIKLPAARQAARTAAEQAARVATTGISTSSRNALAPESESVNALAP